MITQARLKELLHYDPETGVFTRLPGTKPASLAGKRAGTFVARFGWRRVMLEGKTYSEHSLVWLYVYGQFPDRSLRHINGCKTDNRITNLGLGVTRKDGGQPLTVERLKEALHYDPDTGVFTRLKSAYRELEGKPVSRTLAPQGYLMICIGRKLHKASRLAWFYVHGRWPRRLIDHIDGDRLNDRIANLREATYSQNAYNTKTRSDNKSGVKGVYWCKRDKCWIAHIAVEKKRQVIGYFKTREEAINARKVAASALHGEFHYKSK